MKRWRVLCDFQNGSPIKVGDHRWEFTALLSAVVRNRLHPQLDRAYIVRKILTGQSARDRARQVTET